MQKKTNYPALVFLCVSLFSLIWLFTSGMRAVDAAAVSSLGKENVRTLVPDADAISYLSDAAESVDPGIFHGIVLYLSPELNFFVELVRVFARIFM